MFDYDHDSRLVLADWLEDREDPRAALVRLHARYMLAAHADRYAERHAEKAYYAELFRLGGWLLPDAVSRLVRALMPAGVNRTWLLAYDCHTSIMPVLEADQGVHPNTPAIRRLAARHPDRLVIRAHSADVAIRVRPLSRYATRESEPSWVVDQGPRNTHVYPGRHATVIDAVIPCEWFAGALLVSFSSRGHIMRYTLQRSGLPALTFTGELICEADTSRFAGVDQNRWYVVGVYRTDAGKYIAHVEYRTRWQGESDHAQAVVVDDANALPAWFASIDPLAHVEGYPPHPQYAEKRERLAKVLRAQWTAALTETYSHAGLTESVE